MESTSQKLGHDINYYVIAAILTGVALFSVGVTIEPVEEGKLNFYGIIQTASFGAASLFSFHIANRYWKSDVFGKAYLALGIAYALYFTGDVLWDIHVTILHVANPYPGIPDIGYLGFFPFAIYHLKTNIKYFKRKLDYKQKLLLIVIPLSITSIFTVISIIPIDASKGLFHLVMQAMPEYDTSFYTEFFMSVLYVAVTTLTFSLALIGFQVFRNGILGAAWGLLLVGISLNTLADVYYYHLEVFGAYDEQSPINSIWVAGTIFVCYALYKHKEL